MDRKITVKIGASAFTIEEDAYRTLEGYLDDIGSRLDDQTRNEILGDLEMRIADLLATLQGAPDNTVTLYMVRKVQETIGRPEEFGELKQPHNPQPEPETKRLSRTSGDKVIGGVCGGIAKFTNIDPTLLRVATMLCVIFGGLSLWIYIILWLFMPLDKKLK